MGSGNMLAVVCTVYIPWCCTGLRTHPYGLPSTLSPQSNTMSQPASNQTDSKGKSGGFSLNSNTADKIGQGLQDGLAKFGFNAPGTSADAKGASKA